MGRRTRLEEILDNSTAQVDQGPSKSMRKRDAASAQKLGERLIGLGDAELAKLALPERLLDALRAARSMRQHGALARQRQFIGRLMRDVDPEPLLELLEKSTRAQALETERFRRTEAWRDRLIAEGDTALVAVRESCALTAEQEARLAKLTNLSRRNGSSAAQRAAAARELFRMLRDLLEPLGSSEPRRRS